MTCLTDIERHLSSIVETDFTVDSVASDLCTEGFYRVTRFKARERVIGKYEPFQVTKDLLYKLSQIPFVYCIDQHLKLCKLDLGTETKTAIYGDLLTMDFSDVVFDKDITLLGLYCIAHKVWKKNWKLPNLNISSASMRKQLLGWMSV